MPIDFEQEVSSSMVQDANKKPVYKLDISVKLSFSTLDEGAAEIRNHIDQITRIIDKLQKPNHQ